MLSVACGVEGGCVSGLGRFKGVDKEKKATTYHIRIRVITIPQDLVDIYIPPRSQPDRNYTQPNSSGSLLTLDRQRG